MLKGIIRGSEVRFQNLASSALKLSKEMFNFVHWGKDHGLDLQASIEFNDYNTLGMGYGVTLKEPIQCGTKLFRFPCRHTISSADDGPFKTSELTKIKANAEAIQKDYFEFDKAKGKYTYNLLLLTYKLLCYKNIKDSSMKGYVESLPFVELPNLATWRMEVLSEVESRSLIDHIKSIYSVINRFYYRLFETDDGKLPPIPADDFRWTLALVGSRYAPIQTKDNTLYLCPFIDYLNHSFTPNCELTLEEDQNEKWIAARSLCDIKENEQLLINYGNMSNYMLAQKYGFAIKGNPYSCIPIVIGSDKYSEIIEDGIETKKELVKKHLGIKAYEARNGLLYKDKVDNNLLAQLRIWLMDPMDVISVYEEKKFDFTKRLNKSNEARVKDVLLDTLYSKWQRVSKIDYKKAKEELKVFKTIHDYNLYTARILEEEEYEILKYNIDVAKKLT